MDRPPNLSLAEQLAATQDWWRDAGVDQVFGDEPIALLHPPEGDAGPARPDEPARQTASEPPPVPRLGGERAHWPMSLDDFRQFWLQAARVDGGGSRPSVPPRGPAQAQLAVLVPMPEEEDRDTLLSGRHGALLSGFLKAAGIAEDRTYFASALPHHLPMPDWDGLTAQGLGDLAAHHLALSGARRVLVLGSRLPSLLGHDPAQPPSLFRKISANSRDMPALACHGPVQLLQNARLRAHLWHGWLDWTKA